jgi:nitrogen regulatory protein PII
MKLVIITAIKEFEKDIKKILEKSNVKSFSYQKVTGFRDSSKDSVNSNWFASEMNEIESIMFHVFTTNENAEKIFSLGRNFNEELVDLSKVHVSVINVEQSN